jgi:hypothetical protein
MTNDIPEIKTEFAFRIRLNFKQRVYYNATRGYRRSFVPVISGTIDGPRLQGRVIPNSGADFAMSGKLDAHYMLEASDGTPIYIHNMGYMVPLGRPFPTEENLSVDEDVPARLKVGPDVPMYCRLTPQFDCRPGPHDWLTRTVIVGTATRHSNPDHTMFYYYAVF